MNCIPIVILRVKHILGWIHKYFDLASYLNLKSQQYYPSFQVEYHANVFVLESLELFRFQRHSVQLILSPSFILQLPFFSPNTFRVKHESWLLMVSILLVSFSLLGMQLMIAQSVLILLIYESVFALVHVLRLFNFHQFISRVRVIILCGSSGITSNETPNNCDDSRANT